MHSDQKIDQKITPTFGIEISETKEKKQDIQDSEKENRPPSMIISESPSILPITKTLNFDNIESNNEINENSELTNISLLSIQKYKTSDNKFDLSKCQSLPKLVQKKEETFMEIYNRETLSLDKKSLVKSTPKSGTSKFTKSKPNSNSSVKINIINIPQCVKAQERKILPEIKETDESQLSELRSLDQAESDACFIEYRSDKIAHH